MPLLTDGDHKSQSGNLVGASASTHRSRSNMRNNQTDEVRGPYEDNLPPVNKRMENVHGSGSV